MYTKDVIQQQHRSHFSAKAYIECKQSFQWKNVKGLAELERAEWIPMPADWRDGMANLYMYEKR